MKLSQGALLLVHGFSSELWLAIFITIIALALSFSFAQWMFKCDENGNSTCLSLIETVFETFWNLIYFLLQQEQSDGARRHIRRISINSLFIFLSLFAVIFINLYQNVVYSQIENLKHNAPFRSKKVLVSLISKGDLTLLTSSPDIAYFDLVNNSDSEHFKLIRNALKSNPLKVVPSSDEAFRVLETEKKGYVYVCLRYAAMRLAFNNCEAVIVDVDTPTLWNGFIVNKNQTRLAKKLD